MSGPASAIEAAFFVTLNQYKRPDGSIFYAPANDPSLNLSIPISFISGLDNYPVPMPQGGGSGSSFASCPQFSGDTGTAFQGNDFPSIYLNTTAWDGTNQTVALIEFDGFIGAPFCAEGGAPCAVNSDCCNGATCAGTCSGTFVTGPHLYAKTVHGAAANVSVTQKVVNPGSLVPLGGTNDEVSKNVEMVYAMAPKAQIVAYEWNTGGGGSSMSSSAFIQLMTTVANDVSLAHPAHVIANAWTWFGVTTNPDPGVSTVLLQTAVQGQSFFQAAGDGGAYNNTVPANGVPEPIMDSSLMTVVGGTLLQTTGSTAAAYTKETVWNNDANFPGAQVSGGGLCDGYTATSGTHYPQLPLPRFQRNVPGHCTTGNALCTLDTDCGANGPCATVSNPSGSRMIPDVSIVADQVTLVETKYTASAPRPSARAPSARAPWRAPAARASRSGSGQGSPR